jgi:hypothetical protein
MSIQEVAPEQLAQLFHHYHQALTANSNGLSVAQSESWEQIPQKEKKRLVAAARLTLLELSATPTKEEGSRPYFAKPGEAEWGC